MLRYGSSQRTLMATCVLTGHFSGELHRRMQYPAIHGSWVPPRVLHLSPKLPRYVAILRSHSDQADPGMGSQQLHVRSMAPTTYARVCDGMCWRCASSDPPEDSV